jgi:putative ABC transport system substrate-binding protein
LADGQNDVIDPWRTNPCPHLNLPNPWWLGRGKLGRLVRFTGKEMRRREFIGVVAAAAATWSLGARAQQKPLPVIGYLHFSNSAQRLHDAFLRGLKGVGYSEGQNVVIEYRWSNGPTDKVAVADLVRQKVDVIVAFGPPLARAAKEATSTIPIVFEVGNDAVEAGLVASLARPGGNATGINVLFTQLTPKLLEIISEIVPGIKIVGLMVNPNSPTAEPTIRDAQQAARAKGIQLTIQRTNIASDIDDAFAALTKLHADALIVGPDPLFGDQRLRLIDQAKRARIPTIYFSDGFTASGGLISYGPNLADIYLRMGVYVGKILKGEKPADLPVEQPTKFELLINLTTAKSLGLTVPASLLSRADEVIE